MKPTQEDIRDLRALIVGECGSLWDMDLDLVPQGFTKALLSSLQKFGTETPGRIAIGLCISGAWDEPGDMEACPVNTDGCGWSDFVEAVLESLENIQAYRDGDSLSWLFEEAEDTILGK
jgi:hypothetical protein